MPQGFRVMMCITDAQCSQDIFRKKHLAHPLCEILAEDQTDEVENKESDQKTENQCNYDQEETAHQTDQQ
jgi:hypothetical protein